MTQQNRETLLALADRAEKATGSSFELFAEAFEAIHGGRAALGPIWSQFCSLLDAEAWLDAAMSLVPEGDLHLEIKRGKVWAFVGSPIRAATAATPALALCAASLRARATLDPTGEKA